MVLYPDYGPKAGRSQYVRLRRDLCRHLGGPLGAAAHHELGAVWNVPQPDDALAPFSGYFIFDTSRFSVAWIEAFVTGYERLIGQAAEHPSRSVEQLLAEH